MKIKVDRFLEICANFPCKRDTLLMKSRIFFFFCFFQVSQYYSYLSISSGFQEFEEDKEVPERMGATAAGENVQGLLRQVAGRQEWTKDGVHVQAQLLQDGVCLQIRGLHVQAHSAHTGSSGKHRKKNKLSSPVVINCNQLQTFVLLSASNYH